VEAKKNPAYLRSLRKAAVEFKAALEDYLSLLQSFLAAEVLALTKLNGNQTRLDGRIPITLRTARTVGNLLRHHDSDAPLSGRNAHYM